MACAEAGVPFSSFPFINGMAEAMDGEKSASAGRVLVKAAHDLMLATGRQYEAPTFHLRLVIKSAHWNQHCQDIADHVTRVLKLLEPMQKQAFGAGDATALLGGGARGALYGSMGLGGGLGALYWLLSRHANQDESDAESMQHQLHYYNSLSRELSDSMRRKYDYDVSKQPTTHKPNVIA